MKRLNGPEHFQTRKKMENRLSVPSFFMFFNSCKTYSGKESFINFTNLQKWFYLRLVFDFPNQIFHVTKGSFGHAQYWTRMFCFDLK